MVRQLTCHKGVLKPLRSQLPPGCGSPGKRRHRVAGAFGSRVEVKAPGLNKGRPFHVTAPADRQHVLVLRLTRHADGTVTSAQELVAAR